MKLRCSIDDRLPTVIWSDEKKLRQVLINLLSNALKFTSKGGTVHVRGRREHSNYLFRVKDNGKGMTREQLSHVFERFYQGKNEHNKHGLGLGLSIVKSLVEMHGGEIYAERGNYAKAAFCYEELAVLNQNNDQSFNR